jgi:phosphate transport system protein
VASVDDERSDALGEPEAAGPGGAELPDFRPRYTDSIEQIRADVVKLAAYCGEQIGAATQALLDRDLVLADRVRNDKAEVLARATELEHRVFALMAREAPLAGDLRTLIAVMRILQELSLTSGLMSNVAKVTRRIFPAELDPRVRGILQRMGAQASVQLHLAVDAFADRDEATASALADMDDVMDDAYRDLFRAIFDRGAGSETELQLAVETASLGRDYERAGDHTVMIARWTRFMVTGAFPGEEGSD